MNAYTPGNSRCSYFSKMNEWAHCGDTAFHAASDKGNTEIIQLLLNYGSDVNGQNKVYRMQHNLGYDQMITADEAQYS